MSDEYLRWQAAMLHQSLAIRRIGLLGGPRQCGKTMQSMAEAMDCKFVYAVVPNNEVEAIIKQRAK